jgi:2'-5' RNA ligase
MNPYEGTYLPLINLNVHIDIPFKEEDLLKDNAVTTQPIERAHHVTLHFGLPFDHEKYSKIAAEHKPFTVTVAGLDRFMNKDKEFRDKTLHSYDILWVDIKDDEGKLLALHESLAQEFNMEWTQPSFHSHLTLAYLEYDTAYKYIEEFNNKMKPQTIVIDRFEVRRYRDRTGIPVEYKLGN